MKLLLLGSGGHGKVVEEIARSMFDSEGKPLYSCIDYLDDKSESAIGKISDLPVIGQNYDYVFCAIGNNHTRRELIHSIKENGFKMPILIHQSAYISPTAKIETGTIIEPKAIINTDARIGEGCIISLNAIIDHDAIIGNYSHINAGAICKAGSIIDDEQKIDCGEVVHGYN